MTARIVDLRYRMKGVLGALDHGEIVFVLHRGKQKAKLTPISSSEGANGGGATTKDQPLFGLWSGRKDVADPDSYVRRLRALRHLSLVAFRSQHQP